MRQDHIISCKEDMIHANSSEEISEGTDFGKNADHMHVNRWLIKIIIIRLNTEKFSGYWID